MARQITHQTALRLINIAGLQREIGDALYEAGTDLRLACELAHKAAEYAARAGVELERALNARPTPPPEPPIVGFDFHAAHKMLSRPSSATAR